MQTLYCWRCEEEVPMLDETEFEEISNVYIACMKAAKRYRREHAATLEETPLDELYRPVRETYEEMTGASGYPADEIRKHRLALCGPPCRSCGRPLRSPQAQWCVACGERRQVA